MIKKNSCLNSRRIFFLVVVISVIVVFFEALSQVGRITDIDKRESLIAYVHSQDYFLLSEEFKNKQDIDISENEEECYPPTILPARCFQAGLSIPKENVSAVRDILEKKGEYTRITRYTGAFEYFPEYKDESVDTTKSLHIFLYQEPFWDWLR